MARASIDERAYEFLCREEAGQGGPRDSDTRAERILTVEFAVGARKTRPQQQWVSLKRTNRRRDTVANSTLRRYRGSGALHERHLVSELLAGTSTDKALSVNLTPERSTSGRRVIRAKATVASQHAVSRALSAPQAEHALDWLLSSRGLSQLPLANRSTDLSRLFSLAALRRI